MFCHTNVTVYVPVYMTCIHVVQNTPVSGPTLHENMQVNVPDMLKVGMLEVGMLEVGMLEVSMLEVGTLEVGTLEVSMLEVGMQSIHAICSLAISVG